MRGEVEFQRRHFEFIATTIAVELMHDLTKADRLRVATRFADSLQATNPNFNRARFLGACGVV
jgi:hypothetical protein